MTRNWIVRNVVILFGLCCSLNVYGAGAAPTPAQIKAAAEDPARNLAALLSDASVNQAADVTKAVIAQALMLGLPLEQIEYVVSVAMSNIPTPLQLVFASALGAAIAGCSVICQTPGVLTVIQNAVAVAGGANLATALGDAFQAAQTGTGGNPTRKDQAPPVATGYEGQNQ